MNSFDFYINENIVKLSKENFTEKDATEIVKELSNIYCSNYRHKYSSITGKIYEIIGNDFNRLYTLQSNIELLEFIWNKIITSNDANEEIKRKFEKFIDYLSLEITRLEREKFDRKSTESSQMNIEKKLLKNEEKLEDINTTYNKIIESLQNSKIEVVSVLGIFSAIIVTFMGGISFSNSALENLNNEPFFRTLFVVSLLGLILFNSLFILISFITKLMEKKNTFVWIIVSVDFIIILSMIFSIYLGFFYYK